jgi:trigger factor
METSFERSTATLGRLSVTITEEDYKPVVNKKIREYTKTAHIKGFRPGHVPQEYIQKIYGKSIKAEEISNLLNQSVDGYIKDNKLKTVGDATIVVEEGDKDHDFVNDKEFRFKFDIGTASDFTVDLNQIPTITNYEIEPSDDRIDEAIADVRKRYGKDQEVEEVEVEENDLVFGTLKQDALSPEAEAYMNENVAIPSDRIMADAKHIFKGLEKGSSVKFDVQNVFENPKHLQYALNISEEEANRLMGEVEFTVTKITRVMPAELDQELFDKAFGVGKVTNEEELRNEIRNLIKDNYKRESGFMLDYSIEKTLDESIKIDLPDEFLKNWLYKINEGKFSMEQIEKDYDSVARGLRLDLIRNEIAVLGDVKIEYNDVLEVAKNEIRGYFGGYGYEGMEDMIDNMANRALKDDKDRSRFREYFNQAYKAKITDYTKTQVKIDSKIVSLEEFNEVAKNIYGALATTDELVEA